MPIPRPWSAWTGARRFRTRFRGGIVALGNFDGFHKGHQAVVGRAVARARAEGRPALVATFDPHPVRFFKPDVPPFRLTTLDQRERLFGAAGADAMLVFHFDAELAQVTAPDFVADHLVSRVGAAGVVTGEDFTFGKGRGGDVEVLKLLGQANRLSVDAVAPVSEDGEPVSSSRIREALDAGDRETAARLLTRPFAIEGVVEHGDQLGRTLGYPTANIAARPLSAPALRRLCGARAAAGRPDCWTASPISAPGRCSIRRRNCSSPISSISTARFTGRRSRSSCISFIRDERSFESLDALKAQIARDCEAARARLAR